MKKLQNNPLISHNFFGKKVYTPNMWLKNVQKQTHSQVFWKLFYDSKQKGQLRFRAYVKSIVRKIKKKKNWIFLTKLFWLQIQIQTMYLIKELKKCPQVIFGFERRKSSFKKTEKSRFFFHFSSWNYFTWISEEKKWDFNFYINSYWVRNNSCKNFFFKKIVKHK